MLFPQTDAAQSAGKVPIDVDKLGIDLLSLSGHKIYGPKGIGALFVRAHKPRVRLQPIIDGGGQERGLRSGEGRSFRHTKRRLESGRFESVSAQERST